MARLFVELLGWRLEASAGRVQTREAAVETLDAPMAGVVILGPPGGAPLAPVGAPVAPGQVVAAIVEDDGTVSEISALAPGRVAQVLVEAGQRVELGQALLELVPADIGYHPTGPGRLTG